MYLLLPNKWLIPLPILEVSTKGDMVCSIFLVKTGRFAKPANLVSIFFWMKSLEGWEVFLILASILGILRGGTLIQRVAGFVQFWVAYVKQKMPGYMQSILQEMWFALAVVYPSAGSSHWGGLRLACSLILFILFFLVSISMRHTIKLGCPFPCCCAQVVCCSRHRLQTPFVGLSDFASG